MMHPIFLVGSLLAILFLGPLHALGTGPDFSMNACVGTAKHIVAGHLHADGSLHEVRSIRGKLQEATQYRIAGGDFYFNSLEKVIGGNSPMEVVAFLADISNPDSCGIAQAPNGLIAFTSAGGVCGFFSEKFQRLQRLRIHESWTRTEFLASLDQSLARFDKLDLIIELPRSSHRMEAFSRFIKENIDWSKVGPEDPFSWRWNDGYLFHCCIRNTLKPSPEEEMVLGTELQAASSDDEIAVTLAMIANTRCSKSLFDSILPFLDRSKSGVVRNKPSEH